MIDILIVEDDTNLRETLQDCLELEDYRVAACATIHDAKDWWSRYKARLLVLDIMLPDGTGFELARYLQSNGDPLILMLTALDQEKDLVEGFVAGADDYLTKPYRSAELLLRIKALLRRKTKIEAAVETEDARAHTQFNEFTVDWQGRKVTHGTTEVHLTKTAFDILAFLYSQQDNPCSRDQILDAVWGENVYVDNRTVDNFVHNLKKQLNLADGSQYRIKTVRGVGYCLNRV